MTSIFSKIISERQAHFIYEDDVCVAILDIRPANNGHCLVIPKSEIDEWTDLPADTVIHLMAISHKVGKAQKLAFDCERVGIMIAGFEVPHAHIHLIPINSMKDFEFGTKQATDQELTEVKAILLSALNH